MEHAEFTREEIAIRKQKKTHRRERRWDLSCLQGLFVEKGCGDNITNGDKSKR